MNPSEELSLIGNCLTSLGELLKEKSEKGKIKADSRIGFINSLLPVLRMGQAKKQNILMSPAAGKKETLLAAKFLDTLAQSLLYYSDNQPFPQNLQTDLKNKAKELASWFEDSPESESLR